MSKSFKDCEMDNLEREREDGDFCDIGNDVSEFDDEPPFADEPSDDFPDEQDPRDDEPEDGSPFRDYDEPQDMSDVEADADTLASAGYGTDEDYCHDTPMGEDYGGE